MISIKIFFSSFVLHTALTLSIHWANSADDKVMVFFPNRILHFMHIVSLGYNLHEMSNSIFSVKKKKVASDYRLS